MLGDWLTCSREWNLYVTNLVLVRAPCCPDNTDHVCWTVTCAGCLQLLEIYWNLKTLLEILEISLNLYGTGNFFVTCRWSTALVSNHDKTGYRIAYL